MENDLSNSCARGHSSENRMFQEFESCLIGRILLKTRLLWRICNTRPQQRAVEQVIVAITVSFALCEPKHPETAVCGQFGHEPFTKDGCKYFE